MVISVRTIGPPLEQRVDKATFWSPFQPYCLMVLQCPFWGGHRDNSTLRLRIFPRNLWQAQSCSLSGHSCRSDPVWATARSGRGSQTVQRAGEHCLSCAATQALAPAKALAWPGVMKCQLWHHLLPHRTDARVPCLPAPLACVKLVHLWLYSRLAFNSFCCCIGKASLCPYFSVGMPMRTVCPF